jgi:hypothetical protein
LSKSSRSSGSSGLVLTFWGKVRAVDTNTRTDAFLQQNERRFNSTAQETIFL